MALFRVRWNKGMTVATVLVLGGGTVMVLDDSVLGTSPGTLRTVGLGIVIVGSVVYLGARTWMLTRQRN